MSYDAKKPALKWINQNQAIIKQAVRFSGLFESSVGSALRDYAALMPSARMSEIMTQATQMSSVSNRIYRDLQASISVFDKIASPGALSQNSMKAMFDVTNRFGGFHRALMQTHYESTRRLAVSLRPLSAAKLAPIVAASNAVGPLAQMMCGSAERMRQACAPLDLAARPRISLLAYRPPIVLQKLASKVLAETDESGDELEIQAANVGVGAGTLATGIVVDAAVHVMQSLGFSQLAGPGQTTPLVPFNIPNLIVGEVQQKIRDDPDQLNNPLLYEELGSVQLTRLSSGIVTGITSCNSLCPHGEKLFAYTDRFVEACLCLNQYWDVTRPALCELIRHLYFMLYEGLGSGRRRFLGGGLIGEDEAEVIYDIQDLRNSYCDHDIERGSRVGADKADLKALFNRYGVGPLPRTSEDFGTMSLMLLAKVKVFLDLLLKRLRDKHGNETSK